MKIRIQPWDWQQIIGTIFMTPLMVALLCGFLGFMMEPSMLFEDGVVKGLLFILFMFVWPSSLYYILVFPRNYNCMTFVRKEMSYRELKKEIEETYFQEPISLEYGHFLISDKWIVLGSDLNNPTCIPRERIDEVRVSLGDIKKGINPIIINGVIISLALDNGKKAQTGYLVKNEDIEIADYILEREFPGKYVNALGEPDNMEKNTEDYKRASDLIESMKNAGFKGTFKINADIDGVTYDVVWEKSHNARFGVGFYYHGGDDQICWKFRYNGEDEHEGYEDLHTDTNDKLIEILEEYNRAEHYIVTWTGLFGKKHATWVLGDENLERYRKGRKYTVYRI